MRRSIAIAVLALILPKLSQAQVALPNQNFESQLKAIRSQALQKQVSPASVAQVNLEIDEFIGINIREPRFNLSVRGNKFMNQFTFTGDLEAMAYPMNPSRPSYGYYLRGTGVDVRVARYGFDGDYLLEGSYQAGEKTKSIRITISSQALFRYKIQGIGMDLTITTDSFGRDRYFIKGTVETSHFGEKDLAILGACVASLAYSE